MTDRTVKITIPLKRLLLDIETALDGTVTFYVVQTKPLRVIDKITVRGAQLDHIHNIICGAWENAEDLA